MEKYKGPYQPEKYEKPVAKVLEFKPRPAFSAPEVEERSKTLKISA